MPATQPVGGKPAVSGWLWLISSIVACLVGVLAGAYLFPEVKVVEKVVEKVAYKEIEKRVEVPVEKVVEKIVIKEIEKRVEVPVEKVVYRTLEVPVPILGVEKILQTDVTPKGWSVLRHGLTKSEVRDALGAPESELERDGAIYWYYAKGTQGTLFVRFKVGGLLNADRVDLWLGPSVQARSLAEDSLRILEMAKKAQGLGNLPLSLTYAESAVLVDPDNAQAVALVAKIRSQLVGKDQRR